MALPGSTFQQLLLGIQNDFQRLDLLTQPPIGPQPSDTIWLAAQEAIAIYQPSIFIPGQALSRWVSTFTNQKYYALPPDFETDGQILFNVYGQNTPITKISVQMMDELDVQIPPVIGPSAYYCIYGTAANIFGSVSAQWQANFNYTTLWQSSQGPGNVPYLIVDSSGNIQALTSLRGMGNSGGVQPVWPTQVGQTIADQDLVWTTWFNMANPLGSVMRLFPTPDNVYPMTAVYTSIIPMPTTLATSNFWTTTAEAMIRHCADGIIRQNTVHEPPPIWQSDFARALIEYNKLQGIVRQATGVGRARPYYL